MTILAHRGVTATARDNSRHAIESVRDAVAMGVPLGIELDVRETTDCLVLGHEPDFEGRMIAPSGSAALAAHFGSGELMRLEDVLVACTNMPVVNLEFKTIEAVEQTLAMVRAHCEATGQPKSTFVFSSFLPALVRQLKTIAADFYIGFLIDCYFPVWLHPNGPGLVLDRFAKNHLDIDPLTTWILRAFDWTGADGLHPNWTHASPRLFAELAERGKKATFWTVNDAELMAALVANPGTAHIVTDFPHFLLDAIHPTDGHRKYRDPLAVGNTQTAAAIS